MATTRIIRRIMHSPRDLMILVGDVEAYPEFITLLSALRVTNRSQISDVHERFEADATVAYKFVRESFRSLVNIHHDKSKISVSKPSQSGAVRTLRNTWNFHELSDGSTLIDFEIEVKMKAFPLEILLKEKFESAGQKIMGLFEAKANRTCEKVGNPDLPLKAEYQRLGLLDAFSEEA